jgi:DNA-binding CsgD family transcriptional regulator
MCLIQKPCRLATTTFKIDGGNRRRYFSVCNIIFYFTWVKGDRITFMKNERMFQDALSFLMGQYNRVWDGNQWTIGIGNNNEEFVHFSPREMEVLKLMADGEPDKAIAKMLSLNCQTVKNYVMSIRDKLGTKNRSHSIIKAIKLGLLKI